MSESLQTLKAKMMVCRESIGLEESGVHDLSSEAETRLSPEETARLFASLKAELGALSAQYQAALTILTCGDSEAPQQAISQGSNLNCVIENRGIPEDI
ncbi:hypothetical protein FBU59_006388 [Linderina macrospora]|uniref:Uncharacterized protein n=1 Tax=Linderina macrospora TaxID=4868 RepID=A0ACC1J034_9FUNG|nr:hypothetical protein FBU59_006388 [Linderina macrospora]